jgi:hypothetical protein
LQLLDGRLEDVPELALRAEPPLRGAELEPERHQPLLGAVVEVALDPPALFVAGRDDAGAGLLDEHELRAELGMEAGILEREPRGGRCIADESGLVLEACVVD